MRVCSAEEFVNLKLAGKNRLISEHVMNNSKLIKCTLLIEYMKIDIKFNLFDRDYWYFYFTALEMKR